MLEESLHHYEGKLNLQLAAQNTTTRNNSITNSVKCFNRLSVKEKIKQNNSGVSIYKLAYLKILTKVTEHVYV